MLRTPSRALFLGGLIVCVLGCTGRFHRSKQANPLASGDKSGANTKGTANEYPQLVSPGPVAGDVAQAAREYHSRRPVAERYQQPLLGTDSEEEQAGDSNAESFKPGNRAGSAVRPAGGNTPGHAPDYSWIQGKLEYSALSGGIWRVRYAPLSADDEYGGCVILHAPPNVQQFRNGDAVYVEGRIVEPNTRGPLPNPVYLVDLMERG